MTMTGFASNVIIAMQVYTYSEIKQSYDAEAYN